MANLGDLVVRIVGDITDFNKSIDAAQSRFNAATSNFQKMGANLTKFVTLPILGIGAAAVKSAADMEMQQAAFETMLGSADAAKSMLKELADFAAKTPFSLPDLTEASKMMLSFGITAEKIMPNIKMLGDIAQGDASKLKSLTLAFSQIQSTGRLMGQDLLQLINAGFNPLQIISEKTGKSMGQLKKEMEQGAISAQMVSDAFVVATSEGGRFFNGMEKASKTFNGQMSTLMDDVGALGRSFAEMLLPVLKDIVAGISGFVKQMAALDPETKKQIMQFALLAAAIGPVVTVVLKLVEAFNFLKANPIVLGLSLVAAGVIAIADSLDRAKRGAEDLTKALKGTYDLELLRSAIRELDGLIEAKRKEIQVNMEAGEQDLQLQSSRKELIKLESQRTGLLGDLRIALKKAEAAEFGMGDAVKKSVSSSSALTFAITEQKDAVDELQRQEMEVWAWEQQYLADKAKAEGDLNGELFRQQQEVAAWEEAYLKKKNENWVNTWKSIGATVADAFSQMTQAFINNENPFKAFAKTILSTVGDMIIAFGTLTEAEAWATFPIVDLAKAAQGIALAVAGGAIKAGAAMLADGGIVMPRPGGVPAIIGEAGQAEAVIPLDRLDSMLASPGGIGGSDGMSHIIVNLDSRPLLDKIFDATRNKTVLISAGAVV